MTKILKKIISFILLVTFLTSNNVYPYPIKTELRPPLQTSSENINRLTETLNREKRDKAISALASNQTVFTDEQKKVILEEIRKYSTSFFQNAKEFLEKLEQTGFITPQNRETIFTILKEIPQYARRSTWSAYNSLEALLESGLITEPNHEKVLKDFTAILKEIPRFQDEESSRSSDYDSLTALLQSGLITGTNQEEVFTILKEIPHHERYGINKAYGRLKALLESGLITETIQQEVFTILKEIPQYAESHTDSDYYSLIVLLKSGLITETNYEKILKDFAIILKEIHQDAGSNIWSVYDSLEALLESGLITETIQEEVFTILKEISQYARDYIPRTYNSLEALLESGLITEPIQEEVFTILKEISQYAGRSTWSAYNSLKALLESGLITETNQEEIFSILKEIPQYAKGIAGDAYNSLKALLQSGLITEANQKEVFAILREIPQYTGKGTYDAYNNLKVLLESGLITETNQEKVFTILKEIPQYAKSDTHNAYKSLLDVLQLMKQKNLSLDHDSLGVILDMIRQGGNGSGVRDTLNAIKDFISARVKDPEVELGQGSSNSLSALLNSVSDGKTAESLYAESRSIFAASNMHTQGNLSVYNFAIGLEQFGLKRGLIAKLTGRIPSNDDKIEKNPVIIKLKEKKIWLTPYLADEIAKKKTQENINNYLNILLSQIQQFEIGPALTQSEVISEERKSIFYNWLTMQYPSVMARVTYRGFEKSPLVSSILNALKGDDFYISDSDIIETINLSLDIDEMVRKYAAINHLNDDLWVTSFREQVRLHAEFIRWYLSSVKEGGVEIKYTLEYFILSCLSIYGGMFGEETGKFKDILSESISKNFAIFVKLSLGEKSLKGAEIDSLIDKLLYESFTTLDKEKEENLLWGIQPYQKAYYSILRCIEASEPSLFILSRNSHRAFEEAVEKVSQDTKGEIVRMPLSYFSERSDLFGMSVPSEQGNPEFLLGVIPRMAERALANPNTPIYLVLDNIEAVQDSLRVELNPVLWEKSLVIPEINKRFIVPKNLHIIFSMDESSEMHDEAFLNRVLRQRIGGLSKEDFKNLLANKHGISGEWAGELSNLFFRLGQEAWKQHGLFFSAQDFVNIAIYAKNRGEKTGFLKEEAYRYINLRFRYQKDREKFNIVFNSLFGAIPEEYKHSHIEIRNGRLIADGVSIGVSEEFAASAGSNPGKEFSEIVLEDYDYAIRGIDLMLISQLARQAAFGDKSTSRVIVLEGVSGEGKTQLCQVVSRILGYKNLGFTVHKRSALEEFRGGVFPGKEGLEIHNDTPFLEAEREGGYLINFSELNTSFKNSLPYWLYPEFSLAGKRLLPEIPAHIGAGEPFYTNPISSRNIYVVDINPDDYRARERFPQQNKNFSTTFWMGYDYSEEGEKYQKGVKREIIELTKELFRIHFSSLPKGEMDKYSAILGELYYFLQKDISSGQIRSLYQVLTLRDAIRTIKMFRYYEEAKGQDSETAFKNAIKSCLWLMWQEKEPQEKIKARLQEMNLWIKEDLDIRGFISDALVSHLGHLIIHSNAVGDGYEIIKEALPAENITHYMSMSDFIELENLTGETSVDLEGRLGVFQGALLKIIEQAESDPGKEHFFILDNFHQLNPDTAIGLNKALQEGKIELSPSLASVYKGRLVDSRFAIIPENLKIVALTYITKEPSHDDKLPMSGAELSRLVSVALPGEMAGFWVEGYLRDKLRAEGIKQEVVENIIFVARLIHEAYVKEYEEGNHSQIRLAKRDLDEYLAQILRNKDNLDAKVIGEIAYYTIGMCLSDKMREPFMPRSPPSLEYIQKNGAIYLKVGHAEHKTNYSDITSSLSKSYLCLVDEVLEIYESILSAYMENRKLILLEGPPGGGKTAIAEDIAKRLNLRFKKVSMYREIDLWEFLGKIERVGPSKFKITCGKEDGKFISEFLDFLENGGVWCFDEANISKASIEAMSFITQIARGEPIDLGIYHNGIKIEEHLISVHPDFKAFITINPWETTKERKDIPLEVLWLAKKIHVTDNWKEESYRKLIDYYLEDKNAMTHEDIGRLIKLHIYMKYIMDEQFKNSYKGDIIEEVKDFSFSEFNELYTYQYGVSPREIIRITELVNRNIGLFEAILLNYLFQFSAPSDLKRAVDIIEKVFPGFKEFYASWQKERSVYFRGKEVSVGNPERENFFAPVSSQIASLKALALSLSGEKQHTLILSEQGSYPLELVRYFSQATDCELFVFDSNPFVNSVELLGSQMVRFGGLDQKGVAESTDELGTVLGFIGEHLIKEDEYDEKTAQDKPIKILYLSSINTISSEELELLNDFLNTGRIRIGGKNYILPGNVRIVAETSVLRKKSFSSPFYNRFQKIGLGAVIEKDEAFTYLDRYYPGLSAEEKSLIYGAAKTAWYLDMGRYGADCNLGHNKFTYRYGFSMKDVYKLAELVVRERMAQADVKKADSVKTVLTCILRLYGNGLDDTSGKDKSSDRKLYFETLFKEVFSYEGIDENTIKELESRIRDVEREWVDIAVSPKELSDGITLTNGFRIKEEGEYIAIATPINKYRIKKDSLIQEAELSGGLRARLEKDGLLVSISIIKSIGHIDSAMDTNYGLPPEEVPRGDYINYTGAINEVASIIFWASRRVRDSTGRERPPLPIILMGKTGGAKSTIVRNLSRITGAPLHTLHCYDNMEPDALFAGMGIAQKGNERKILLSLKEFFSHLGKINGQYDYPSGKNRHSTRKILFLDEANVSPQILYCLKPLFRGDRNFTFYLFGEKFTVELDPEVVLVIAGNPTETYAGRKSFPWEIIEDGLKIWVPAMHTYLESERVKKEDLVSILFGMHKRKMKELQADAREDDEISANEGEKFTNNARSVINLEQLKVPDAGYARYDKRKPFAEPGKLKKEGAAESIRKDISFEYSIQKIREALKAIGFIQGRIPRYQYFLDNILRDYLLALSDGAGDIKGYKDGDETSLTYMVLETASAIDSGLFESLKDTVSLYLQSSISYSKVKEKLTELRKKVLTNEAVNRFIFSFPILKDNRLFILVEAEKIKERVLIEKGNLEELGIEIAGFSDKTPLMAYVVERHPFMEEKRARGVFKGENYALIYEKSTLAGSGQAEKGELISWVGYHEIGHLVDHIRSLSEQISSHPNIELFSMLFPVIFAKDNKRYIEKELLYLLRSDKDASSYYCQAAKGIFNGFLRVLKEENPGDSQLQEMKEITDSFEEELIDAIYKKIAALDETLISKIGIRLYKDAWEKKFTGDYYLSTAKKGRYKAESGRAKGDTISEFTEGIANPPDVEVKEDEQQEIEQKVEIKSDAEEKENMPDVEFESNGEGGGEEGEVSLEGIVVEKGWLETYYQKLGSFAKKFIDIFASEPKQEEVHSASGRRLDIRKWITLSQKVFKRTIIEESTPSLYMSVTVDVSGSIAGSPALVKAFTNMTKFFESLLYTAGRNTSSVRFSLSAIGEEFHRVFSFDDCKKEDILRGSVQALWQKNDFGGINTENLVTGLRRLYGQSAIPTGNRLHIVLTDGGETSGKSFEELKKMVNSFEEEYGVDVIFIGVGTREVTNYNRYLLLGIEPDDNQLMNILIRIAREKVQRKNLPLGDLSKALGLEVTVLKTRGAPISLASSQTVFTDEQKKAILKEIEKYCSGFILNAKGSLEKLERSGVITPQNRETIFAVLKEIPQYTRGRTNDTYDSLTALLKSGLITEANYEKVLKDFTTILKEIYQYVVDDSWDVYYRLEILLKSGLIKKTNYEEVFTLLKEIPRHAGKNTGSAYDSLKALLKSNLITETNQQEVFSLLREIPQYAKGYTGRACYALIALLQSGLITETNQIEVFTILKEIPQYAKSDTHNAYNSLLEVLKLMKQKNLFLDQDYLAVILDMIKDGGNDSGVIDTLNLIRSFILINVKDPEVETRQGSSNSLSALLSPIDTQKSLTVLSSNQTEFSKEQKKAILEEIKKYCGDYTNNAKKSLERLEQSGVMTPQNRETIFTFLKEIPQYTKEDTRSVYNTLTVLLQSSLITETNYEEAVTILKKIFQYAGIGTWNAYNSLIVLLQSGLITETNQKEIFSILKEIPQYAVNETWRVYDNLITLLQSGLITKTIQKGVFTILKKIPMYARKGTGNAYNTLTALLQSGPVTKTNQEEVFTILKKISQYAGRSAVTTYYSLKAFLESGLITETNHEEVFTLLKEIPQYAKSDTHNAYSSLLEVLKLMKQKNLVLDQDSLAVILDMIKEGGNNSGVKDTLNAIISFISANLKDPEVESGPGSSNSLSALLSPINTQKPLIALGSTQTGFTKEQKKTILEEIEKYSGDYIQKAIESLEKLELSVVITPQSRETIFTILKEIPQHARVFTYYAYNSLTSLLKPGLITETIQEEVFTILKEISQYVEESMFIAYDSLTALFKSGLITEANYDKILKDFTAILREIPKYAGKEDTGRAYSSLKALLGSGLITKASQEEVFSILKEIPQYTGRDTFIAYNSLTVLLKSGLITETNYEKVLKDFTIILKEIPQYAEKYTYRAYDSLTALLQSNLITETNQKEVFAILKETPRYAGIYTNNVYNSLKALLQSNLITETNQKQVFTILEEIPQYAGTSTSSAYSSLKALLQSGLITETNYEEVFTILKEIPQYAEKYTYRAYDSLTALLQSNLITETNQKEVFAVLKEIHQHAGSSIFIAYNSLTVLLKSGLITETNYEKVLKDFIFILKRIYKDVESNTETACSSLILLLKSGLITETNYEEVFTILKEIPQYAAYDSLIALLQSNLITETNQTEVFTILNEILQYARSDAHNAYKSLISVLRLMKQKNLVLDQDSLGVILDMIRQGENDTGVTDTLNAIISFISTNVKDPEAEPGPGSSKSLSALLTPINTQQSLTVLSSNQTAFTDKQKKALLEEIEKYCNYAIQYAKESLEELEQSGVITPQNRETISAVLKEIPQYAGSDTWEAYNSLTALLKSGLITETIQEEVFTILKEIPQYAGDDTWGAYGSLEALLKSGIITETNYEKLLKDFTTILREIPQYAGVLTYNAYGSLIALLKSGIITETNYEQVLKDFTTILKEIPQHAKDDTRRRAYYNSLTALLQSGLITETNQKDVLTFLKEILQYIGGYSWYASNILKVLLESGLITETNHKEVFTILRGISQYAKADIREAYYALKYLLESGLITETNQEEVFTILKEIPQHATYDTHNAYNSLLDVLKLMKQKNLILDEDSLGVILDMIRQGGNDSGVKDTLNAIKDFILARVKDPEGEEGQGFSNNLSVLLSPVPRQSPAVNSIKGTLGLTKAHRSGL